MLSAVGVLTARVRVEEKQLLQSLAAAGVPARTLPPADIPLPIGPMPSDPTSSEMVQDGQFAACRVIVDRCQNRRVAASVLPVLEASGAKILDAGVASTGTRATVAAALSAAGIPRPATLLVTSELSGIGGLARLGYPATLLPLTPGGSEIALLDRDTAEAVFEHRDTLGGAGDSIGILQSGVRLSSERVSVVVINGHAVALTDGVGLGSYLTRYLGIAEAAAGALGASIVGVELLATPDGPVVWDVNPIPEFRDTTPIGDVAPADALAMMAGSFIIPGAFVTQLSLHDEAEIAVTLVREVIDGVALSA